jgi:hypothetical protein
MPRVYLESLSGHDGRGRTCDIFIGNRGPCSYWLQRILLVPALCAYLLAGSLGIFFEARVAFLEVSIDGSFGFVHRLVIAVVDDSAGHAAKYGFDHIEELST